MNEKWKDLDGLYDPVPASFEVRMLSALRIRALIQWSSVESSQSVCILREMCRHPVNDDTDALRMHIIHKSHEVRGRTVA